MVTEPYRPANGGEYSSFDAAWCARCKRDQGYRERDEDGCTIILAAMTHEIDAPGYPAEWIEDDDAPKCTAFEART